MEITNTIEMIEGVSISVFVEMVDAGVIGIHDEVVHDVSTADTDYLTGCVVRLHKVEMGANEGIGVLDNIFVARMIAALKVVYWTGDVIEVDNAGAIFTDAVCDNLMRLDEAEEVEGVKDRTAKENLYDLDVTQVKGVTAPIDLRNVLSTETRMKKSR